jgi:hypothetical protein
MRAALGKFRFTPTVGGLWTSPRAAPHRPSYTEAVIAAGWPNAWDATDRACAFEGIAATLRAPRIAHWSRGDQHALYGTMYSPSVAICRGCGSTHRRPAPHLAIPRPSLEAHGASSFGGSVIMSVRTGDGSDPCPLAPCAIGGSCRHIPSCSANRSRCVSTALYARVNPKWAGVAEPT